MPQVELRVVVNNADTAIRVMQNLSKEGAQIGSVIPASTAKADQALGGLASRVQHVAGVMSQAGVNTGVLGQAVGALSSPFGVAAAGAVAFGLAIKGVTDFMLQNYEQLRKLTAVSGLGAEEADRLADAFELLGVNTEGLHGALFKMSAEIDSGGQAIRRLGVDLRDSEGALKVEGQLFLELRDEISKLGTASERNAALMDIFGRSARDMATIFAMSEEKFREWLETAGKMGPSAEESMRVTEAYRAEVAKLTKSWQGFIEAVGIGVLPALTSVIEKMNEARIASSNFFVEADKWIEGLYQKWNRFQQSFGPGSGWFPGKLSDEQLALAGGIGTSDIVRSRESTGRSGLLKAEIDALTKLNEIARMAALPEGERNIAKLRKELEDLAERTGPAEQAARALVDTILRFAGVDQAIDKVGRSFGLINAQLAAGVITNAAYKAGLEAQIASLQAMGKALDESGTLKLLQLQAALQKFDPGPQLDAMVDSWNEFLEVQRAIEQNNAGLVAAIDAQTEAYENELRVLAALNDARAAEEQRLEEINNAGIVAAIEARAAEYEDELRVLAALGDPARQYQNALESLRVEAAIFGDRFDAVGATISAMENRLRELARTSGGQVTPAMIELRQELEGFYQFRDLRDMFTGIFDQVHAGIARVAEGLALGTRTWKEWGQTALDVIRSVALSILNDLLKQALTPLYRQLATVAATAISGGTPAVAPAAGTGTTLGPFGSGSGQTPGNGFSFGVPTSIFDSGTLSTIGSSVQGAYAYLTGALGQGSEFLGAVSEVGIDLAQLGAGASSLTVVLAGVGAALAVFGTIMDFVNGNVGAGVGGVVGGTVGAIAGGIIGTYVLPGVGTVLGALAGGALGDFLGSIIGGLFGGPSEYDLKRLKAADEANAALGQVAGGYQAAVYGTPADVLAALTGGGGGAASNSVRSELVLSSGLANQLGITGQQIGDQIVAQWIALTQEQFAGVLTAFRESPALIASSVRGSGDVPYLSQGDAEAIAEQIRQGAVALLEAFTKLDEVKDRIREMAPKLVDAAEQILPPEAIPAVEARVNDFRDRLLAVVSEGLPAEEMQKQLDVIGAEMQTYLATITLFGTLTQDIARLSGDVATQTQGAIVGIRAMVDAAADAVEDAQTRADRAVGVEEVLAANTALREAVLARYELEMQLVRDIQAAMQQLLAERKQVDDTLIGLAVADVAKGTTAAFDELYMSLAQMAMTAPTVAQRLYAIAQGLAAVIALAQVNAANFVNGSSIYGPGVNPATVGLQPPPPGGYTIPEQIVSTLAQQAAPFLGALADLIDQARDAGDLRGTLSLLQQQAEAIRALGAAAEQAVRQWATAALAQLEKDAADKVKDATKNWDALEKFINTTADAERLRIEEARDTRIAGLESEISKIQEATKARQEAIALEVKGLEAQQQALSERLAATREWEGVVKNVDGALRSLRLGNQAPLNPADQLALAEGNLDRLFAAFQSGPSAALAGDVQAAVQEFLQAEQGVNQRPSAEYQAAFVKATGILEAVKGIAIGEAGPVSSADLEAQTKAIGERIAELREESQRIGDAAAKQVEILRDQIEEARKNAEDQIKAIEQWRTSELEIARLGRENDLELIEDWKEAQKTVIEDTAQAEINRIRDGVAEALRANAVEQYRILDLLEGQQLEQLRAIIGDQPLQEFTAQKAAETAQYLKEIRDGLGLLPVHAEGTTFARGGLAVLDAGEIVVPPGPSARLRRGGIATTTAAQLERSGGPSITFAPTFHVSGVNDPALVKRAMREQWEEFKRELVTDSTLNRKLRRSLQEV